MAAALLTAALAAAAPADPFAEAFWGKDLGLLVALLAEPGEAAEDRARALFGDVVRLVNCEPLAPVTPDEPSPGRELRLLVRVERARRIRLGAAAGASRTLWRDVLSPAFFRRALAPGPDGTLLLWPVESERWSGEALRARVRPSACAAPLPSAAARAPEASELELLGQTLVSNLVREAETDPSLRAAAARAAYQRAVLLARAGKPAEAKEAAAQLREPERLGPWLDRHARLLRLELGVDPPEGYLALFGEAFGANQPAVDERLAYGLHRSGRWESLRTVTAGPRALAPAALCGPGTSPLPRDLLYRQAVALDRLGAADELDALLAQAFPACAGVSEPAVAALKDVALTHYARRSLDLELEQRLRALDPPGRLSRDVQALGARALHLGNVSGAERAMGWLTADRGAVGRARGWMLEAEIAFALQDGARFDRAVERIFPDPSRDALRPGEREERDRAVEELAQSLVTAVGDQAGGDFRRRLRDQLPRWRDRAALRREPAFDALLAALDARPVLVGDRKRHPAAEVAVGEIAVAAEAEVLPPPAVQVDWPEPYSLLAIPPPPGAHPAEYGAWFASSLEGDDATR